jgi:hypothetical protein
MAEGDTVAAARERQAARAAARRKKPARMRRRRSTAPRRQAREDAAYLKWVHGQPCLVCGAPGTVHHEPPKGMAGGGAWSDRKVAPLCPEHHQYGKHARHEMNRASFEKYHGVEFAPEIERLNAEYNTQNGG